MSFASCKSCKNSNTDANEIIEIHKRLQKGYIAKRRINNKNCCQHFAIYTGGPPRINGDLMVSTRDINVKVGEKFKIPISFYGSPVPTASWYQGHVLINENNRIKLDVEPKLITLSCISAELKDTGRYTLHLKNEKGSDCISLNVVVRCQPRQPENQLEVKDVTEDSRVLIWSPPRRYGGSSCNQYNFPVLAENEQALSTVAQYPYTAPESPLQLAVDDVDKTSVILKWSSPLLDFCHDGGRNLEGYIIEIRNSTSIRWETYNETPIKEPIAKVKGLKHNEEYEFRVRGKNVAGLGTPSDSTGPVQVREKYEFIHVSVKSSGSRGFCRCPADKLHPKSESMLCETCNKRHQFIVEEISFADFTGKCEYLEIDNREDKIERVYPPEEVVRRAREMLGRVNFYACSLNCEHFAYWCRNGKPISKQVPWFPWGKPLWKDVNDYEKNLKEPRENKPSLFSSKEKECCKA